MKTLQIKTFLTCWLLSSLLFLTGCSAWEEDTPAPEDSRQITLVYQQLTTTDVITRNIQTTDEMMVENLYVIFYKPSDNSLAGISMVEVNKAEPGYAVTFSLPDGVSASEAYNVYLLANPENYVGSTTDVKAWLENTLLTVEYDNVPGVLEALAPDGIATPLPMFGKTTKEAAKTTISAELTRLVSRVDLYVDAKVPNSTFRLKSAKIWNARKGSKLLTGSSMDLSTNSDGFVRYDGVKDEENGLDQVEAQLYAFPNYQAVTEKGDEVTTCLIIGGSYNGVDNDMTYYRLNIKPKVGSQLLKPNHRYKITITGVSGPGAKSEEDAYKESDGKLNYTVDEWDGGDMGDGSTDINGNKLSVSPKQVVFSYLAGQTTTVKISKTPGTTLPTPNTITVTSSDDTLFEVIYDGNGSEFIIKVLTDNYGNSDREAYVMVQWGDDLKVPVYITQLGATSTAGGMRAVPNELTFGSSKTSKKATLIVSGDLSPDIKAENIDGKIFRTVNSLEGDPWCSIKDDLYIQKSPGVFEFEIEVEKLETASALSRSAVAYFYLTKDNGEVLNATMSIRQYVGGGPSSGSGDQVTMEFMYYENNNPPADQALTNKDGYSGYGTDIWGFNTTTIVGLPAEYDNQGSRYLHFGITGNRIFKYRLYINSDKDWRIVLKNEAVDKILLSASTPAELAASADPKWIYIAAASDVASPWTGGSIVVEFSDGTEEVFYTLQSGILSYLTGSTDYTKNGKIYYYGTEKTVWGIEMLDRNLGASSNGHFTNEYPTVNATAKGVYFSSQAKAQAACPPGWRLPKGGAGSDEEWGDLFTRAKHGALTVDGVSYTGAWSVQLTDTPTYWLIPLCGESSNSSVAGVAYWYEDGCVVFTTKGTKHWGGTTPLYSCSARCVRDN